MNYVSLYSHLQQHEQSLEGQRSRQYDHSTDCQEYSKRFHQWKHVQMLGSTGPASSASSSLRSKNSNSWQRSRTHSSRCSSRPSGSRVSRSQNTHQKREQTLFLRLLHRREGRRGHLVGGGGGEVEGGHCCSLKQYYRDIMLSIICAELVHDSYIRTCTVFPRVDRALEKSAQAS